MGRRGMLLALIGAALVLPGTALAKKKKDDEREKVDWRHPWLSDAYLRIEPDDWKKHVKGDWTHYERYDETIEYEAGGSIVTTLDFAIRITDPQELPAGLTIGYLSASENEQVVEFEASVTSPTGTDPIGRERLVEASSEGDDVYISGNTLLTLLIPRDKKGLLEVRVARRSEPAVGLETYFGGAVVLHVQAPAATRSVTLVRPEGMELSYETRFFRTATTETTADGKTSTKWEFERLQPGYGNAGMPSVFDSLPVLLYTNQPSWEALGALDRALFEPHISTTEAMDAWLAEQLEGVEGVEGEEARALAIHDAIADGWGYLGFYPAESGWIPHASSHTFDARVGDCKDQSTLMVSLMRSVGIDASPAIIWGGTPFRQPTVPLNIANHAVVYVADAEHPDGGYLLDSTDTGMGAKPVGQWIEGRHALVLHPETPFVFQVPVSASETRQHTQYIDVVVEDDGRGLVRVLESWTGESANRRYALRKQTDPAVWERRSRERLLKAVPGATVHVYDEGPSPEDPEVYTLAAELHVEDLAELHGRYAVVRVPWLTRWRGSDVRVSGSRIHPRQLKGERTHVTVVVNLPPGAEVLSTPGDDADARDDFTRAMTTTRQSDGSVQIELQVEIEAGRMKRRYEELRRTFYDDIAQVQSRPVVLFLAGGN